MTSPPDYDSSAYLSARILKGYTLKHKVKLLIALLCMACVAGSTAIQAYLMEPILDDIFINKKQNMLIPIAGAAFFIAVIKGFATYGQSLIMKLTSQRILTDMQVELYDHLLHSDLQTLSQENSAKIISRFTNDINIMRRSVASVMTGIAKEGLTIIFLVALMFYQNHILAIIAFAIFPTAIYPIIRLGKRMRKISRKTQEELGEFTNRLDETFRGIRVIKAYQQEDYESKKATSTLEKIYHLYAKAANTESASSPIMESLGGIAIAAVILYGGAQVISGTTTAGNFFSFITAFIIAYKPVKSLSGLNTALQEGLAAAKRFFTLIDEKPEITSHADSPKLELEQASITFKDVKFSYTEDTAALKGLSLDIKAGSTIALVGPSGGGKSTIMNLLLRFYDPQSGTIKIDGQDISKVELASLRKQISFVSQDIRLFDDTIRTNIAYGKAEASLEEIEKAAELAAADEFIQQLPQKYDTLIGQDGASLSGGQRQRIAIARAILRDSPILLLDEATSALDSISEKKIQKSLEYLMQNRTTIVIAHRLSTVINSDMIYVLKQGQLAESGTHKQLLGKSGLYNSLYKGLDNETQ